MKNAALALAAISFAACSSSDAFCPDYTNAQKNLVSCSAPVPNDGGVVTAPNDGGTPVTCDSQYKSAACSDADRTALDAIGACVNAIPACTTMSTASAGKFLNAEIACAFGSDAGIAGVVAGTDLPIGVSTGCFSAVGKTVGIP